MPETEQTPQAQESGIFEPKPLDPAMRPLSGTQKAARLSIAAALLILAAVIFVLLHNPFMKPVKLFYKAMSARDSAAMCDAFPDWLVNAETHADTITIKEMCDTLLTAVGYNYGRDAKYTVKYHSKRAVEPERITRIEAGIVSAYDINVTITKGWYVTVHVLIDDGSDEPRTVTQYVRLYKINGRWVMLDVPSDTE